MRPRRRCSCDRQRVPRRRARVGDLCGFPDTAERVPAGSHKTGRCAGVRPKNSTEAQRSGFGRKRRCSGMDETCRLRLLPLLKFACSRSFSAFAVPATIPHGGATSGLRASGGYAPGCVRKIGHSRDTRLTRADRRFSAAPVGTLPTAFGCVPAHIPRPALQAFARKTAGWRTEWAGACTEDSRFVFDHPA